jgi:hypothetical protein
VVPFSAFFDFFFFFRPSLAVEVFVVGASRGVSFPLPLTLLDCDWFSAARLVLALTGFEKMESISVEESMAGFDLTETLSFVEDDFDFALSLDEDAWAVVEGGMMYNE